MHKTRVWGCLGLLLLLLLAACEGYTQSGVKTVENQTMSGGELSVSIGKANGTIVEDIEIGTGSPAGLMLDADVTLSVGKGSYRIELLGDNDEVTLALEAADGQTVSGQGWMATDGFGEAHYRVTAVEAEDVSYTLEYTFR
jgi:hypothetical protein